MVRLHFHAWSIVESEEEKICVAGIVFRIVTALLVASKCIS